MPRAPDRLAAWIAAFAALLAGCSSAVPTQPTTSEPERAAAAAPRTRSFVSPYSYEWFVRAELLMSRGQYTDAAEAYRMVLTSADDDPYVFARLAEALDRAGDHAGADQMLGAGLALDPQSEAIWLERGELARRRGALNAAIAAFERAESAAPEAPDAPLALAALLRAQGDPERANAVLERFAARGDQNRPAALRARLQLAHARNDAAELEHAARAWLQHADSDPDVLQQLASDLLAQHKPALAERVLFALPEAERNARLWLQLALTLAQSDQVELLLTVTPPDRLGGPLEIADAYLQIGRPERALALLDEQTAADEADLNRRTLLTGMAELALGQFAHAALHLARVPANSAYAEQANAGLRQALQSGALDALAKEVATPAARE